MGSAIVQRLKTLYNADAKSVDVSIHGRRQFGTERAAPSETVVTSRPVDGVPELTTANNTIRYIAYFIMHGEEIVYRKCLAAQGLGLGSNRCLPTPDPR